MQTPCSTLASLPARYFIAFCFCLALSFPSETRSAEVEGEEAEFEWEASTGPVSGYQVFIAKNGESFPEEPNTWVGENRVRVKAAPGDSVRVKVAAVSNDGRVSQTSPASESVRFMSPPPPPAPEAADPPEQQTPPPGSGSGSGSAGGEENQVDFDEPSVFEGDPWVFTHAGRFAADLDGDGIDELLWYEVGSGHAEVWFGITEASPEKRRVEFPKGFEILAADHFSGDGSAEALARSRTSGALLQLIGNRFEAQAELPKLRRRWHVASVADLEGDGNRDPVFVGPRSQRALGWKVGATGLLGTARIKTPRTAGLAEHDIEVADLDGDGRTDAVLYDPTTGQAGLWLDVLRRRPAHQEISGIGSGGVLLSAEDLDDNGERELLFQLSDGTLLSWDPQSGLSQELDVVPAGFSFVALGEFDGLAGGLEMLWMDADGVGLLWHLGPGGVEAETVLGN